MKLGNVGKWWDILTRLVSTHYSMGPPAVYILFIFINLILMSFNSGQCSCTKPTSCSLTSEPECICSEGYTERGSLCVGIIFNISIKEKTILLMLIRYRRMFKAPLYRIFILHQFWLDSIVFVRLGLSILMVHALVWYPSILFSSSFNNNYRYKWM